MRGVDLWRRESRFAAAWIMLVVLCLAVFNAACHAGLLSGAGATYTIPAPQGALTLIAYGDTRFADSSDTLDTNPVARQKLIQKIAEEKPSVLLISGDTPLRGADANDYLIFKKETAVWRNEGIKVFPALGNHEFAGCTMLNETPCLENWWDTFPQLRGRRWYSVRMGEVYILTLDSDMDLLPKSQQGRWLAKQLTHLPNETRFVFVSVHHPPVTDMAADLPSHSARPNERALAQQLEAAAATRRNVKFVVISGHIHNYERFEEGGVEYLVAGGGGATPYPVVRTPQDLYKKNTFPNYHFVKFVIDGDALKATMYRLDEKGAFTADDSFELKAGTAR